MGFRNSVLTVLGDWCISVFICTGVLQWRLSRVTAYSLQGLLQWRPPVTAYSLQGLLQR